jgi:hypothetical protein
MQTNQRYSKPLTLLVSPAYKLNPLLAKSKILCLSPVKFQLEEVT